jgi:hypothetical protein
MLSLFILRFFKLFRVTTKHCSALAMQKRQPAQCIPYVLALATSLSNGARVIKSMSSLRRIKLHEPMMFPVANRGGSRGPQPPEAERACWLLGPGLAVLPELEGGKTALLERPFPRSISAESHLKSSFTPLPAVLKLLFNQESTAISKE